MNWFQLTFEYRNKSNQNHYNTQQKNADYDFERELRSS
jgi:hypothetical protein